MYKLERERGIESKRERKRESLRSLMHGSRKFITEKDKEG